MPPKSSKWTVQAIEQCKRRTKQILDAIEERHGLDARLKHSLKRVRELEDDLSRQGMLERYVFSMSALVHHERYQGLNNSQISRLLDISQSLLQAQQLNPQRSRLRFLFAEFHLLKSQLLRRMGLSYDSAWEQQMSGRYVPSDDQEEQARQLLGAGIRSLRLGFGPMALVQLEQAEYTGLPFRQLVLCRLTRITTLRLAQNHLAAQDLLTSTMNLENLQPREKQNLEWERIMLDHNAKGDFSYMLKAVSTKGSHYASVYFLEAYAWTRAVPTTSLMQRIAKVSSKSRSRSLQVHYQGAFYRCLSALEAAYDIEVPFEFRLREAGQLWREIDELLSIDKELLILAAVASWLIRNHAFSQACLLLYRYRTHSLNLSAGQSDDALGIMSEHYGKDWFLGGL